MHIRPATENDVSWLDTVIRDEFPYTSFSPESIAERIKDSHYLIFVAEQVDILTGFLDAEVMPYPYSVLPKEIRLNAIFVAEDWRAQKIAIELIFHLFHVARAMRVPRIFLLVKRDNYPARHLYKKTGFVFERLYEKKIEDNDVEVWSILL